MEKEIIVDHGIRKKLAAGLGTNLVTVRRALRGNATTPLHFAIRAAAMRMGGLVREETREDQRARREAITRENIADALEAQQHTHTALRLVEGLKRNLTQLKKTILNGDKTN